MVAHPQIQIHNWGRGAPTIAADSDEYDVELERAVVYPPSPSNLSAAAGDMNSPDQIDDDAAEAKEERRASSMPKTRFVSLHQNLLHHVKIVLARMMMKLASNVRR